MKVKVFDESHEKDKKNEINDYIYTTTSMSTELNKWYTVVGTYDGSEVKLYIDGILHDSQQANGTIKSSPMEILIGANPNGNSNARFSNIDVTNVDIYNRCLSAEEIEKGYSNEVNIQNEDQILKHIDFTDKKPKIGEKVLESSMKAMLVYVPRYEYKIEGQYGKGGTSEGLPGEIEVNFVSKNTTIGSSGYRIHPSFTFGSEELNGIWVGKFETTGTGDNPTILPSASSLRNQNVSEQFETSQKFNEYITNGDSHMAKNSEWGAIAYLSQSKYGKYGNSNYSGIEKEIMINNCSNYITGIGADSQNASSSTETCTTNTYETSKGQAASTTGNITGIYDMSGGSWEYIMGVLLDPEGKPRSGYTLNSNSGYTGMLEDGTIYSGKEWPESKYYDTYTSTNLTLNSAVLSETACNGGICYGQALSETIRWYGDHSEFVYSVYPWFVRGGNYGRLSVAGIFAFGHFNASAYNYSFRVVIS